MPDSHAFFCRERAAPRPADGWLWGPAQSHRPHRHTAVSDNARHRCPVQRKDLERPRLGHEPHSTVGTMPRTARSQASGLNGTAGACQACKGRRPRWALRTRCAVANVRVGHEPAHGSTAASPTLSLAWAPTRSPPGQPLRAKRPRWPRPTPWAPPGSARPPARPGVSSRDFPAKKRGKARYTRGSWSASLRGIRSCL